MRHLARILAGITAAATLADLAAQTVPLQPRLVRNCTPAAWQSDRVPWSRDVAPANKIDDLIDRSAGDRFDIVVNFKRCVRPSDLTLLDQLTPQGSIQFKSRYLPTVLMAGVLRREILTLAGLPQVAFIEQQVGFAASLGVSTQAIQVRGFYSAGTDAAGIRHDKETVKDIDPALTGAGAGIVVMDTGVDDPGGAGVTHRAFRSATAFYDAITGDDKVNPNDVTGHGTLVASIALGEPVFAGPVEVLAPGVAPGANLIDLRILEGLTEFCSAFYDRTFASLERLYDHREAWGANIVNMSFAQCASSNGLDAFSQLIDLGESMGLVMVAAAGNDGVAGFSSPAAATRAITVAASDDRDTPDRTDDVLGSLSTGEVFSNRGPRADDGDEDHLDELKPEVTAPGTNVLGARFDTSDLAVPLDSKHCVAGSDPDCSGTSLAAPHVAGLAALIFQSSLRLGRSQINPASVKQLLISTADSDRRRGTASRPADDPLWNDRWGWGLINAYEAIRAMRDPARTADLTFPHHGEEPTWLSLDLTTVPERLEVGKPVVVKVTIRNASSSVTARGVIIQFGIHDYSASASAAFSDIGTRTVDVPPGDHEFEIHWTPKAPGHLCLKVEIGYGPDTDYSNNTAQRNLEFAKSPVVFQVQNTLTEGAREIRFVPTLDPPSDDWTVKITPASVVLSADDCPANIEVLLEPRPTAAAGAHQRVHVAALIGDVQLGGVTVEASVPAFLDCNHNGVDDAVDVASGGSADLNGTGVPDECESSFVDWLFLGTAQGGSVTITVAGFSTACTVAVPTLSGQSAATVAQSIAAAMNTDPCLSMQGVTALASGGLVRVSGLGITPSGISESIDDPGLQHEMPIPALSGPSLLALAILLGAFGILLASRQRPPKPF